MSSSVPDSFAIYLSKTEIMQTVTTHDFPFRDELIKLLQIELPLHSVYVIASNIEKNEGRIFLDPSSVVNRISVDYTLLIIGHRAPTKQLGNLTEAIYAKMKGRCRVHPIFYTLRTVLKRLDIGDNFLSRIVRDTPCMFKENDIVEKSCPEGLCLHIRYYQQIVQEWHQRMERAEYILSVVGIIETKEDAAAKLAMMGYALEQVCIALLGIFWEYAPNHFDLPYLMHLCGHFTRLPQEIFPRNTYGLQRQFYMLCNAHHIIRFKGKVGFSSKDSDKVLRRCERFYGEASKLGLVQLENLRKVHTGQS